MTLVLVALGAALGTAARHAAGQAMPGRRATLVVNVLGSLLLGAVVAQAPAAPSYALLGTGFCGAFTTFSAFALETTEGEGRTRYAALTLALCVTAAAVGLVVAGWLS